MKAVVWEGKNNLVLRNNYNNPVCKDDWVVIKVMSAGVCSTDLAIINGDFGEPPVIIGHEICGIITETGSKVTNCKVGDRVVVETAVSCGNCFECQSGNKHLCNDCTEVGFPNIDGGYAQYTTCPCNCIHKIPDSMSYDEGGILEACLCPYGLIDRYGMKLNETVLIYGVGVAGLSFIQSAKLHNPKKIISVIRTESKRELALKFGADVVINNKTENLYERVMEETNGNGVSLAIDAAGAKQTIEELTKVTKKGGRCILYGLPKSKEQIDFPVNDIILKQLQILGGTNNQLAWDSLIDYVADGKFNIKDMISEIYSLDDYLKALDAINSRQDNYIKGVLHPWDE